MNVVDEYSMPTKTQPSLRPVRPSLSQDVLLGGAEYIMRRADRLNAEDY